MVIEIVMEAREHAQWLAKLTNKMALFFTQIAGECMEEIKRSREQESKHSRQTIEDKQKQAVGTVKNNGMRFKNAQEKLHQKEESQEIQEIEDEKNKNSQFYTKKGKARKREALPMFFSHKPKAPASSFLIFLHHQKSKISAMHNEKNISRLTKIASEIWKNLPAAERQWYEKQSELDQKRYHDSMIEYKNDFAHEIQEHRRKKQSQYRNSWMKKKKMIEEKKGSKNELQTSKAPKNNQPSSSSSSSSSGSSRSSSPSRQEVIEIPSQDYDSSLGEFINESKSQN